jgi:hypothetical protein
MSWDIMSVYSKGLQMAVNQSYAMAARRKHSVPTKRPKNHICATQPTKEIPFFSAKISHSILGAMEEEEQISTKDKWLRKKYMGVWSLRSTHMRMIIPKLPPRVTR